MDPDGKDNTEGLLVTTSPDHLALGHGEHACPGRFFAAIEIKILLCHLLLKYEWELSPKYSILIAYNSGFY